MLLGCDVRIGADIDCKIGLNEVAIGMVLPDWALTIAQDRLSRRHIQLAVATAQVTDGDGAVDAGFLDEVVPEADVLLGVAVAPRTVWPHSTAGPTRAPCWRCAAPVLATHGRADHRRPRSGAPLAGRLSATHGSSAHQHREAFQRGDVAGGVRADHLGQLRQA